MLGTARPASAIGEPHLDEEQPRQASAVAGDEFPITPAECFAVCFRGIATNDLPPNSTMRDKCDYRIETVRRQTDRMTVLTRIDFAASIDHAATLSRLVARLVTIMVPFSVGEPLPSS
jgi:hypothetical protein